MIRKVPNCNCGSSFNPSELQGMLSNWTIQDIERLIQQYVDEYTHGTEFDEKLNQIIEEKLEHIEDLLPYATEEEKGCIKATVIEYFDTQTVNIDEETGFLFTKKTIEYHKFIRNGASVSGKNYGEIEGISGFNELVLRESNEILVVLYEDYMDGIMTYRKYYYPEFSEKESSTDKTRNWITFGKDSIECITYQAAIGGSVELIYNYVINPSLPNVTDFDNGKILKVIEGKWQAQTQAPELPTVTVADAGKMLMVDDEGHWIAQSVPYYNGEYSNGLPLTFNSIYRNNGDDNG